MTDPSLGPRPVPASAAAPDAPPTPVVLGVDGRRGRWWGALLHPDGWVDHLDLADASAVRHAADRTGARVIGVDVPIGLPETGQRSADLAARALLRPGGAGSRVFPAPPRAALDARSHAEAVVVARKLTGLGVSVQTWCLRHAIASGAELADDARVVEVHPEVSFLAMTGSVLPSKKTPAGRARRLAALADAVAGLDVTAVPPHDDAVDALACAWTARRWAAGTARVLGGEPDSAGRPMRIVS